MAHDNVYAEIGKVVDTVFTDNSHWLERTKENEALIRLGVAYGQAECLTKSVASLAKLSNSTFGGSNEPT